MNDLIALTVFVLSVVMVIVSVVLSRSNSDIINERIERWAYILRFAGVGFICVSVSLFALSYINFERLPYAFTQEYKVESGTTVDVLLNGANSQIVSFTTEQGEKHTIIANDVTAFSEDKIHRYNKYSYSDTLDDVSSITVSYKPYDIKWIFRKANTKVTIICD